MGVFNSEVSKVSSPQTIGSYLSILFATCVVLCHWRKSRLRAIDYPVLFIAASDICYSTAYFLVCIPSFVLSSFGSTSTVMWTSAVAVMMYYSAQPERSLDKVLVRYGGFCLVGTALATGGGYLAVETDIHDLCWASDKNTIPLTLARFLTLYGPLLLTTVWSLYVYCRVRGRNLRDLDSDVFNCDRRRTKLYPVALFASFGLMMVLRTLDTAGAYSVSSVEYTVAVSLMNFNGVMNSVVFFATDSKFAFRYLRL